MSPTTAAVASNSRPILREEIAPTTPAYAAEESEREDEDQYTYNLPLVSRIFNNNEFREEDLIGEISIAILDLPTLRSLHDYNKNGELIQRRRELLSLAIFATEREFDESYGGLTRRQLRDVFSDISKEIDELLISPESRLTNKKEVRVYRPSKARYMKVRATLSYFSNKCREYLYIAGNIPPEVPLWGKTGNIKQFYAAHEFECLAVLYRSEVEKFLATYDQEYNFLKGEPRNPEALKAINNPLLPTAKQIASPKDLPPHFAIDNRSNRSRSSSRESRNCLDNPYAFIAPTASNPFETVSTFNRQRSRYYNNGEEELQRLRNKQRDSTGYKPTSGILHDILEDKGDRFKAGEQRGRSTSQDRKVNSRREVSRRRNSRDRDRQGSSRDRNQRSNSRDRYRRGNSRHRDRRNPQKSRSRERKDRPSSRRINTGGGQHIDDDDSGDDDRLPGNRRNQDRQPQLNRAPPQLNQARGNVQEPHFDFKLKFESVPKWDGNTDTIIRWITKINNLSLMSGAVFQS